MTLLSGVLSLIIRGLNNPAVQAAALQAIRLGSASVLRSTTTHLRKNTSKYRNARRF